MRDVSSTGVYSDKSMCYEILLLPRERERE